MKTLLDMVKDIERSFSEAWYQDFMKDAYTSLLLVKHEKFDVDQSSLDLEILEEGKKRKIEKTEIQEAMKYIKEKFPSIIHSAMIEASFALREYRQKITPIFVDFSTDIFADEESFEERKTIITKKLDSLDSIDFTYEIEKWGAQYDYEDIDITEHMWVSIHIYAIEVTDIEIIKDSLEQAGCSIEIF